MVPFVRPKGNSRTMNSTMPSRRTAWRFLCVWGGLAVFLFVLAGYLTYVIVRVNSGEWIFGQLPPPGNWQDIGIFSNEVGDVRSTTFVRYNYDEKEKTSNITLFSQLSSAKIVLNNVTSCSEPDVPDPEAPWVTKEKQLKLIPLDKPNSNDWSAIDWSTTAKPEEGSYPLVIECKLNSIVEEETFTTRRIFFRNLPYLMDEQIRGAPITWGEYGPPVKWTLDVSNIDGIDKIAFQGGTGLFAPSSDRQNILQLGSARDIIPSSPIDFVALRWESQSHESRRDIIIVVIGSLIALGAAMLLEGLRPFVERLIGHHDPQ
jgi:hypothetical protein